MFIITIIILKYFSGLCLQVNTAIAFRAEKKRLEKTRRLKYFCSSAILVLKEKESKRRLQT